MFFFFNLKAYRKTTSEQAILGANKTRKINVLEMLQCEYMHIHSFKNIGIDFFKHTFANFFIFSSSYSSKLFYINIEIRVFPQVKVFKK